MLKAQAAEAAGAPVGLRFVIGQVAEPTPQERMQNLIDFGSKFDSFQIK